METSVSTDGSNPATQAVATPAPPDQARFAPGHAPGDGSGQDLDGAVPGSGRRRARAIVATVLILALVAAGAWVALRGRLPGRQAAPPPATVQTATSTVERLDVVEREQVGGNLGYEGSYSVVGQAAGADPRQGGAAAGGSGVVTWLPEPGRLVRRGQRLYEVDNRAVRLLYGSRPASRQFALGMTDGPDVTQLERNLVRLGHDPNHTVTVDRHFSAATGAAVRRWQRATGEPATGVVALGRVVFLPAAIRVAQAPATVGGPLPAGTPVLTATGTARVVAVDLDPGQATTVRVRDRVLVTLPDGDTAPGRVSGISRVAVTPSGDGGDQGGPPPRPSITVTIRLDKPPTGASARLDQAPVQVAITTRERDGVLTVPVTALLARHGGGYDVELVEGGSGRTVPVEVGLYDEITGRVEVDGAGLAEGLTIKVPVE
jgi:peptidoglycan hydrolase-like protein with peptidoglycan-binding domain